MPDGSRSLDAPQDRAPTALTDVYRAHARYVWRVLRHCGVPDADLDDAVQETFLVVFRRLPELEARAALRTWIYAVAVRVASTRRRSARREAARREKAGAQLHATLSADPEAALSKLEAARLVDQLLDGLDTAKRTVFVLAELEGVKVPEISRILGVNPRTVHSRLRLARERFGSELRRMQAHEQGNLRVARLRPRPLLDQAANERPPAPRRKAALAALAVRIEQGAAPLLPGWETLALSGSAGAWVMPAAVVGLVGLVGLVAVVAVALTPRAPPAPAPGPAPTSTRAERQPASHRDATPPPSRSDAPSPTQEADPVTLPSSPEPSSPLAPSPPASPSPARPRTSTNPPSTTPAPAATTAPAIDPSSLAAETRLLERAREALRAGEHANALTALDTHLAEFPHGVLLDEARSTRLRTLCRAGRGDEARALAERLAPAQLDSRWHHVVAAACR